MADWYGGLKWVVAGIVCIGLGIVLIVSPDLRANPKELTASDVTPGVGAILVGTVMLLLFFYPFFRRKKAQDSSTGTDLEAGQRGNSDSTSMRR
jgi:hypothetical protein